MPAMRVLYRAVRSSATYRAGQLGRPPRLLQGECSVHGRVRLVAPPGLDERIAEQLVGVVSRLVAATEEHAEAIGYGQHLKVGSGLGYMHVTLRLPPCRPNNLLAVPPAAGGPTTTADHGHDRPAPLQK